MDVQRAVAFSQTVMELALLLMLLEEQEALQEQLPTMLVLMTMILDSMMQMLTVMLASTIARSAIAAVHAIQSTGARFSYSCTTYHIAMLAF